MAKMTEVLYTGRYYRAEVIHHPVKGDSLVVTHIRKRGGKQLLPGANADAWIDAIRTAVDPDEASDLCRAILRE